MAGLALLVGVPLVLWAAIGNPLSGFPQTWDEAELLVDQRNITADLLISVLACLLWLLWLQFVWAVLWELFVVGPRTNRGEVAKDAPGVPGFVRSIVSTVVSGLLSASVVASATSAGTLLPDLVAKAPALALDHAALNELAATDQPVSAAANITHYVIGDHDRVWDLAGQNDTMLQRILEMNADQVKSPIDFRPGMQIRVPASLALPEAPPTAAGGVAHGPSHDGADAIGHQIYQVVEGDNLWNISKERLAADSELDPSNAEIAAHVADVVDNNQNVVEDPDLIYPGELLTLPDQNGATPGAGVASSGATAEGRGADQATESAGEAEAEVETVPTSVSTPRPDTVAVAEAISDTAAGPPDNADRPEPPGADLSLVDAGQGNGEPQQAGSVSGDDDPDDVQLMVDGAVSSTPTSATIDSTPVEMADEQGSRTVDVGAPPPRSIGVELAGGGLALSTSLLALYLGARRRNEGRFTVEFSRRVPAEEPALLSQIYGAADLDFIDWAADRLNRCQADAANDGTTPGALLLTAGHGLETWWSTPVTLAAAGWTRADSSGRRWTASWDPTVDSELPADVDAAQLEPVERSPLGWLTVGKLLDPGAGQAVSHQPDAPPGSDVMINLGHVGSIALSGATARVFAALRAMLFELGAGGPLADVTVTTVDFQAEGSAVLPRLFAAREEDALAQAQAGHPDGALQIFVVQATQARLDQWFELSRPDSGVALIAIGDVRSSRLGSRYVLHDDGTGLFQGLEAGLRVLGLEGPEALQIEELLLTGDATVDAPPEAPTGQMSESLPSTAGDRAGVGHRAGGGD
jgi:hypothetical protein